MAAIRFSANRIATYPMNETNKKKEYYTAKQILLNNQYDPKMLDKAIEKINSIKNNEMEKNTEKESTTTQIKPRTKWDKFTYVGNQTKFITK